MAQKPRPRVVFQGHEYEFLGYKHVRGSLFVEFGPIGGGSPVTSVFWRRVWFKRRPETRAAAEAFEQEVQARRVGSRRGPRLAPKNPG